MWESSRTNSSRCYNYSILFWTMVSYDSCCDNFDTSTHSKIDWETSFCITGSNHIGVVLHERHNLEFLDSTIKWQSFTRYIIIMSRKIMNFFQRNSILFRHLVPCLTSFWLLIGISTNFLYTKEWLILRNFLIIILAMLVSKRQLG